MSTPTKLAAFAAGLAAAFGVAAAVGAAVGPIDVGGDPDEPPALTAVTEPAHGADGH